MTTVARQESRLARTAEPAIRRGLRVGFAVAREAITDDVVAQAMIGALASVTRTIPWNTLNNRLYGPIEDGLLEAARAAARIAAREIPRRALVTKAEDPLAAMGFRFDRTNEEAVRWARGHAARLVVGITAQTRAAINAVIVRMFRDGVPPAQAARIIRSLVGLHPRYALAVDNRRRALTASGMDPAEVTEKVTAYAARLERVRATAIARTESITASSAGQHELWQQARASGLLEGDRVQREWLVAHDERLCERCLSVPTNGLVGLDDLFTADDGTEVLYPPLHVSCRCSLRLVFDA